MIKQTISVVKNISEKSTMPIGQLIYDLNGEYANANQQDNGSIADILLGGLRSISYDEQPGVSSDPEQLL